SQASGDYVGGKQDHRVLSKRWRNIGEGEEKLSSESFSSPSPNPTPSSSKTFVFIESLLGDFSCGRRMEEKTFSCGQKETA
ncbi:hypothetical protein, partial [Bilophila wadsworthia]|uniref:hypothetical protein n=1 Tax=Bilophila wadsworthia TaxID=35833 RepID=UPI00242EB2A1